MSDCATDELKAPLIVRSGGEVEALKLRYHGKVQEMQSIVHRDKRRSMNALIREVKVA